MTENYLRIQPAETAVGDRIIVNPTRPRSPRRALLVDNVFTLASGTIIVSGRKLYVDRPMVAQYGRRTVVLLRDDDEITRFELA